MAQVPVSLPPTSEIQMEFLASAFLQYVATAGIWSEQSEYITLVFFLTVILPFKEKQKRTDLILMIKYEKFRPARMGAFSCPLAGLSV